jgi:hypothetical protein
MEQIGRELGKIYRRPARFPQRALVGRLEIKSQHDGSSERMSALGQKQTSGHDVCFTPKRTLRRVLDMIESVGKVLKLLEHRHEISP